MERLVRENDELSKQNEILKGSLEVLHKENDKANAALLDSTANLKANVEMLERDNKKLVDDLCANSGTIKNITLENNKMKTQIESMNDQINSLKEQNHKQNEVLDTTKKVLAGKETEIKEIKDKFNEDMKEW